MRRQPSLEELLEEAETLLIMQQAALRSQCRDGESESRLITVANTLDHLRTHLGLIKTMIAQVERPRLFSG